MRCSSAAKHAPIAADPTVRVGARRGQRSHASSPQALPITATIKTLIYPYFSDLDRFPLRALQLLGGGKEIGNRLFWGPFFSFCFSTGYRRAGVLFPQLFIYFLRSAALQAHTHTRLMGHLPALLDLEMAQPRPTSHLYLSLFNIRYLGFASVWPLTSILLYLVACLLFWRESECVLLMTFWPMLDRLERKRKGRGKEWRGRGSCRPCLYHCFHTCLLFCFGFRPFRDMLAKECVAARPLR